MTMVIGIMAILTFHYYRSRTNQVSWTSLPSCSKMSKIPISSFQVRRPTARVRQTTADAELRCILYAAVIYLKNRVNRAWIKSSIHPNEHLIPEDEKQRLRACLLPIFAAAQGPVRVQFVPILQRILFSDFPDNWPGFIPFMMELLTTNDLASVSTGLRCLFAVSRMYRYRTTDSNRGPFEKIIEASFPRLLAVCNELVNQESEEAGELCHLALKIYKHATWVSGIVIVSLHQDR